MAGRPLRRLRQMMNPVEFDTSRAASVKEMRGRWSDTDLGPWLPGVRSRLVKTGAKLIPMVRVILPDINNRFTVDQVTPEIGVVKILASSENAGPHALKGVNFWHRLFDEQVGLWYLVPEDVPKSQLQDWYDENVPDLQHLRVGLPGKKVLELNRALSATAYGQRRGGYLTQADLFPVVRSNMPSPGWNTSEDRYADEMASVLGFIRGLRLSVLRPDQIYQIKRGALRGLTPEQVADAGGWLDRLPTPEEEAELRTIIAPLEAHAEKIIQHNFAKAAAVGMVMLWEQPNAANYTKGMAPAGYESSREAIRALMRRAKPPPGYRVAG